MKSTYSIAIILVLAMASIIILTPKNVYTTQDKNATVACGEAFFYSDTVTTTKQHVVELELLALQLCRSSERTTTSYLNTSGKHKGKPKHAVLIKGEVCIINWELTPEEHLRAFNEVCNK